MILNKGTMILFDTNIVMDIATQREGFASSFAAYDVAVILKCKPYLAVSATTDIAYLLLSSKYRLKTAQAKNALNNLFLMFELLDVCAQDTHAALASKMADYEDALLSHCALRQGYKLIITWNKKDFASSPIEAMTPDEFLEAFKPENYEYDLIEF